MVCQITSMSYVVYNKTKISLSSVIIETSNTSWSEANQQLYCGSTTRPRRYGRRSMVVKRANIRRPIKRQRPLIARSILRRKNELLSEVLLFCLIYQGSHIYLQSQPCSLKVSSISPSVTPDSIMSVSGKVRECRVDSCCLASIFIIISSNMPSTSSS